MRVRPLVYFAIVLVVAAGCGSAQRSATKTRAATTVDAVRANVDLAAAAGKLLASGSAHVVYDLTVQPPSRSPLQFVTHAAGDFDFARGSASYVATTPLGEASRTIVVGARRWTRSLGGGAAGAGNAPTGWRRARGPDLSPAGVATLVPLAGDGARDVRRIGPDQYEATIATARAPSRVRSYLQGVFGAATGLAQFVLDRRGRLVVLRLVNTTALTGHSIVYRYAYTKLGERVRVAPPR
jgi:hypothetical protein